MRRSAVAVCGVAALLVLALVATAAPGVAANPHGGPPGQLRRQPDKAHCDPIETTQCLTPFPDDFYTVRDATSPTGRRVPRRPVAP